MICIPNLHKPKSCFNCWFNKDDLECMITHGGIDRDDWTCEISCPIKEGEDKDE